AFVQMADGPHRGMAWQVDSAVSGRLQITWEPQRAVDIGVALGGIGVLLVAALAVGRRRVDEQLVETVEPGPMRTRPALVLVAVTTGPVAAVVPLVGRWARSGRRWVLTVPFAAMWAWTSARQLRWDVPVDLRWPASMAWAQWLVVAVVAAVCWAALTED
ncbi:MAG: hypothetical protein ACO3D0_08120, partial [Ilumatobacteraceae bacterium]